MKYGLTLALLTAFLGGCAIVPLGPAYYGDGYSRGHGYYRGDGRYHGYYRGYSDRGYDYQGRGW